MDRGELILFEKFGRKREPEGKKNLKTERKNGRKPDPSRTPNPGRVGHPRQNLGKGRATRLISIRSGPAFTIVNAPWVIVAIQGLLSSALDLTQAANVQAIGSS